jgi:DNA-binding NarL/FixJ family response regulator
MMVSVPQVAACNDVRVIVVDDSRVFLEAICFALRRSPGIKVVGAAHDAETARYLIRQHLPQLAVVDIRMPTTSGIELTREIRAAHPEVRVIALTVSHDEEDLSDVLRAGACGYVLKPVAGDELPKAILAAVNGESWLTPRMTTKLIASYLRSGSMVVRETLDEDVPALTPRERGVLSSIAQGRTNKQIAADLYIAETTVKTHLKSIFAKLEVRNRAEATAAAWRLSLVDATSSEIADA